MIILYYFFRQIARGIPKEFNDLIIFSTTLFGVLQIKPLKKIHPFFWFVFGAIVGIIFKF